jgi:hypothetical protein
MVFMEDSERAAELAKDEGVEIGLHINFSQRFTGRAKDRSLLRHHDRVVRFLTINKYALLLYHPGLRRDFLYVYDAQMEEFQRLYGRAPFHFDGHQHMHLCTNMLLSNLIPRGAIVRRNFSFRLGEKDIVSTLYRGIVDMWLANRYRLTDYFFALSAHIGFGRLNRIGTLARGANVELMTHLIKPNEFASLMIDDSFVAISEVLARSRSEAAR